MTFDRPREGQIVYEAIDWDHPRHSRSSRPTGRSSPNRTARGLPDRGSGAGDVHRRLLEMRELFNESAQASADELFAVALTEYQFRDFSLVDVMQAGCSKGTALEDWARARGYPRDEVMAVGDNLNDIEMLEFAGTPVVMGNGIPDLQTRGWAVTATNDEAGVARAVETFILGRRVLNLWHGHEWRSATIGEGARQPQGRPAAARGGPRRRGRQGKKEAAHAPRRGKKRGRCSRPVADGSRSAWR